MGARKPVPVRETESTEAGWRSQAECRWEDAEIFHPTGQYDPAHEALAVCRECPVVAECLAFALSVEEVTGTRYGVYGGMTAAQRGNHVRKLARRAKRSAA